MYTFAALVVFVLLHNTYVPLYHTSRMTGTLHTEVEGGEYMAKDGRGWHGDPEGHARAGAQSSGNPNAAKNLTPEARSKGGRASSGNFANDREKASRAGKKGGKR